MLSERERRARRRGAWAVLAKYDATYLTSSGRASRLRNIEKEVDPTGELDPAERARRVKYALKLKMSDLGRRSGQARRKKGAS